MDIDKLSIDELAKLRDDVTSLLQDRVQARQDELKAEVERIAQLTGQSAPRAVPRAKYVHPSNPALTWSSRGSQPKWVQDWIAGGGTLEQLKGA